MSAKLTEMLTSIDELNHHLAADPELAVNMAEMGFIKRQPFQLDHNGATVAKWDWTEYGRREIMERLNAAAEFEFGKGASRQ